MRKFLILAVLGGCSFAFQSRPSKGRNECTSSPMLAVVDTVAMVTGVAGVIAGAAIGGDAGNVIAGASGVGGVVYLASGVEGFRWAGRCSELQRSPVAAR